MLLLDPVDGQPVSEAEAQGPDGLSFELPFEEGAHEVDCYRRFHPCPSQDGKSLQFQHVRPPQSSRFLV